jgi:hypothetical protein
MRPFVRSRSVRIEPERDRLAPRVIRDIGVVSVCRIGPSGAVEKRRCLTHFLRAAHESARTGHNRVDRRGHLAGELLHVRQTRTPECQPVVVVREALGEPQLARHVHVVELEWLERSRPDTLHVPAVKELVRDRSKQSHAVVADRRGRRDHRAVAMLHPVAARPRHIVRDERVGVPFVCGKLAEHASFLANNALDVAQEGRDLGVSASVMQRQSKHRSPRFVLNGERCEA